MNTVLAKACFLKLKLDTPLSLDLSKSAASILYALAKLKNVFLLSPKLMSKTFDVLIILQAISVSVILIMPFFIILSSLTISPTCLK